MKYQAVIYDREGFIIEHEVFRSFHSVLDYMTLKYLIGGSKIEVTKWDEKTGKRI